MDIKTLFICLLVLGKIACAEDQPSPDVFQSLYKPIAELPNISMEWTDEKGGVVINRREFLHDSGRFIHKTYHMTKDGERLNTILSYDGEFYYCLNKDVLTVSTSLQGDLIRPVFRAAFVYNPIFLPLSFSMSKYPGDFVLPSLRDPKVWTLDWGKQTIPITASLFETTDGNNVYQFKFANGQIKYGERIKGEFLCRWTIDDWFTIPSNNVKYQIPTSITLSFPEGHTYFYDCFRVNQSKCKLLKEPALNDAFRVPASSARKVRANF